MHGKLCSQLILSCTNLDFLFAVFGGLTMTPPATYRVLMDGHKGSIGVLWNIMESILTWSPVWPSAAGYHPTAAGTRLIT
jgi:hypothetical protein